METYTGIIRFSPLEGGFLQLVADDGTIYQLTGKIKGLKDGQRVSLRGKIQKSRVTFAMSGPVLDVKETIASE